VLKSLEVEPWIGRKVQPRGFASFRSFRSFKIKKIDDIVSRYVRSLGCLNKTRTGKIAHTLNLRDR